MCRLAAEPSARAHVGHLHTHHLVHASCHVATSAQPFAPSLCGQQHQDIVAQLRVESRCPCHASGCLGCCHALANPALSRLALTPPHRPILLHASAAIKGPPPSILSAPVIVSLSAPVSRCHAPLFFSTAATVNSSPHGPSLLMRRSQRSPWTTRNLRTGWPHRWSTGSAAPRHHASDHPPSSVSHRSAGARLPSCVVACS
jgi:hypothetical protein